VAGADCIDVAASPAVVSSGLNYKLLVNLLLPLSKREFGFQDCVVDGLANDRKTRIFAKRNLTRLNVQQTARVLVACCPLKLLFFIATLTLFLGWCPELLRMLDVYRFVLVSWYTHMCRARSNPRPWCFLNCDEPLLKFTHKMGRLSGLGCGEKVRLPWIDRLKVVAISCLMEPSLIDYLWASDLITPSCPNHE